MSLGRGTVLRYSLKQKLNVKSSTEGEILGQMNDWVWYFGVKFLLNLKDKRWSIKNCIRISRVPQSWN